MNPSRQLDRLELFAAAYLVLPLAMFILGWLRWPYALVAGALLALTCQSVLRGAQDVRGPAVSRRVWCLAAVVLALWIGLSGLVGGLPLTSDWQVRMVVLRDLATGSWPVGYGEGQGGQLVLRFSMGFYLLPAAIGKLLGVAAARIALGLWTAVGVALFFALAIKALPRVSLATALVTLAVLVVFSGMDVVGFWLNLDHLPAPGQHIEWWDRYMQYSSQTTLLFWAPNHALPGWLAGAILWRHREAGLAVVAGALIMLAACIWSPLVVVGLAPLLLASSLRGSTAGAWIRELLRPAVLAVLPILLVLAAFVTFGVPEEIVALAAAQTELQVGLVPTLLPFYFRFAFLEWAFVAVVIWRAGRQSALFWVAAAGLLLLPLLRFGPGNDVVMRGGIAPLTLMALACIATLVSRSTPWLARLALIAALLVGCYTPWQELRRQFLPGSNWPDDGRSLFQQHGSPWHYVGVLRPGWLKQVLRDPVPIGHGP